MEKKLSGNRFEISKNDELYPKSLLAIPDAPAVLYGIGDPAAMADGIAIVGSRRISDYGIECTEMFAAETAKKGITIISGGARGCDTIAHRAALQYGTPTVAVLGGGCDRVYPSENFDTFQLIIDKGGCVVSEHDFNISPEPWMFRSRNRLIAAMAKATLITEAALPSGTFAMADYCQQFGKDLMVVPGDITRPQAQGVNHLISEGAMPILSVENYCETLDRLQVEPCLTEDRNGDLRLGRWKIRLVDEGIHKNEVGSYVLDREDLGMFGLPFVEFHDANRSPSLITRWNMETLLGLDPDQPDRSLQGNVNKLRLKYRPDCELSASEARLLRDKLNELAETKYHDRLQGASIGVQQKIDRCSSLREAGEQAKKASTALNDQANAQPAKVQEAR